MFNLPNVCQMEVNYPKVKSSNDQRVFIEFYQNKKRYRLFNGSKINVEIHPNSYPIGRRIEIGNQLASEVYRLLTKGISIEMLKTSLDIKPNMSDIDYIKVALEKKLKENYSEKYKSMLRFCYRCLLKENTIQTISQKHIKNIIAKYTAGVSQNTIKRHLSVLINEAKSIGMISDPMLNIKTKKTNAKLHKPYQNIAKILQEINQFNPNLYLCCIMTYGCLLRPHREIRELTWSDFSDDLKYIHLSGNRNKSGRNRIVPVPSYVRDILVKGERHHNIFSNKPQPLNQDYFKTLWSRFKRQSNILEQGQTLYSFRHSGAIEIFKRTGSITKLQKAMGHSSINVSLTYLRSLEIAELREEDMPMV
jgi:integrase